MNRWFVRPSTKLIRSSRFGTVIQSKAVEVLGQTIAYLEAGSGPPVVFLHGGLCTSQIWREVIPHLAPSAHCVAIDPIGTGFSSRTDAIDGYRFTRQSSYLSALFEILDFEQPVTLVLHGWASLPGLDWARRFPGRVRGVCLMEAVVRPLAWPNLPESYRKALQIARSPEGEGFVMKTDAFFDEVIRTQVGEPLPPKVIEEYRKGLGPPGEGRRALHTAINSLPVSGRPFDTFDLAKRNADWFDTTEIPKLIILGEPGYLLKGREFSPAFQPPNQTVARVSGHHLLPEESPDGVGLFLNLWHDQIHLTRSSGT